MSAAARIVKPGGLIILACECREGVPAGSAFERLLHRAATLEELAAQLDAPGTTLPEQWQVQILAQVRRKAEVLLHSSLPDDAVLRCHLQPCHDVSATVCERLQALDLEARVAVLPQGPLTIPQLA